MLIADASIVPRQYHVSMKFFRGREESTMELGNVPCNGCTLCCRGDAILLLPGDSDDYQTEPHSLTGQRMLARKPNGHCIYLGAAGCTIYDRRPQLCREFDCRGLAQNFTFTQARKMNNAGIVNLVVWRRGKDLLSDEKTIESTGD